MPSSQSDEPTPEELERVRQYHRRKADEQERRYREERERRLEVRLAEVSDKLVGRRITSTEGTRLNSDGEVAALVLTLDDGQRVTIESDRWSDPSGLDVEWGAA